jgi:hypothetical protein
VPDLHGVHAPVEPGNAAPGAGLFPLLLFLSRAVHAGRDDTGVYHAATLPVKRWREAGRRYGLTRWEAEALHSRNIKGTASLFRQRFTLMCLPRQTTTGLSDSHDSKATGEVDYADVLVKH